MKKLVVLAHPQKIGFSYAICDAFVHGAEQAGHETYVMNLYDNKWKQEYLQFDDKGKPLPDEKTPLIQEKITWADEIVFIFPVWWFDAPAILKNWLDVNFTSGFSHKYKKGSLIPHKLLKGKKARVFTTSGSPSWVMWTAGIGMFLSWFFGRLWYVGVSLSSFMVIGSMPRKQSQKWQNKKLAIVKKIAKK